MKTNMIKSFVAAATFLTLTVACSKKDDNLPLSKQNLLGKWNATTARAVTKNMNGTILFEKTGTDFTNTYFDYRNNDTLYNQTYHEGVFDRDTLFYKINGNQIITTDKDKEEETYIVNQLTKNKLTVFSSIQDEVSEQPVTIEYTYSFAR